MKGEGVPDPLEARARALESELAHRETLLAAAFASSYDGLAILSAEGVFLEINDAWARLTGTERSEWIGRHMDEMQRRPASRAAGEPASDGHPGLTTLVNARDSESVHITASPHLGPNGECCTSCEPAQHHAPESPEVPARARPRRLEAGSVAQRRQYLGSRLRMAGSRRDLRQRAARTCCSRPRNRRVRLDRAALRRDRDRQGVVAHAAPALAAPTSRSSR
jgi:PAS domain-containing protein